jgi:predicted metalloprotease with PDZ domain
MLYKLAYFFLCLFVFIALHPSAAAQTQATADQYRIRISERDPLHAFIQAEIPVKNGRLFMAPWGADFLPNGWATFVRDFKVSEESNRPLAFEPKPNGEWQIANNFNGRVRLSYKVDLAFTKTKWKYGNEQAGVFQDNALFIVSKALFIVSDADGRRELVFDQPPSWKISAPWKSSNTKPHGFIVDNNNNLINNSLVVGQYADYTFRQGNFTLMVALLGSMKGSGILVAPALQKVVQRYGRIFNKTPPGKYLMTIFYADEADAEAFANSAAFTEHDPLTRRNLIRWGNTLAHEFFHSWNGAAIQGEDYASSQWFGEGFTEYFANLALVQQRLISEDVFIRKMENNLGLYLYFKSAPAFNGITLKQAGSKKGLYRLGVYDGGWAVAFCLDLLIRDETQGRKSLEDFMRLMYEKFRKYVEGDEMLAIKQYLARAGFDGYTQFYDGEIYIFETASPGRKELAIRQALLNGR